MTVTNKPAPAAPGPLPFPVVGLGASAGGLESLLRFFENMPADCGMAFVVILHLSPRHESNVDQIIQRVTSMPVLEVAAPAAIEKNHIYVISPALNLEMVDGHLQVNAADRPPQRQVAIDLFFRTLADAHKARAVAIVLSGTGADGAVGMARVKEQGGLTIAQLPEDAEFDGMPQSAIDHGVVDFVMPAVEMPQKLLELWRNAQRIELPCEDKVADISRLPTSQEKAGEAEAALAKVLKLLAERSGHNFQYYKRATVLRRIERRMQVTAVSDLPGYLALLERQHSETAPLLADMLIGVTNFFRDREAFEALEREVVPLLFQQAADEQSDIRIWVPACSTGEEAYSLAIVLAAEAKLRSTAVRTQVFATDVDDHAISMARKGLYDATIVTDVPPAYLRQYFIKEGSRYGIVKSIRESILFAPHNVLRDPPFSRLRLIACRNLLIYLDRHAQREVLKVFHSVLRPGGYLFLGSSETPDAAEGLFTVVDKKNRIYRSTPTAATVSPAFYTAKQGSLTTASHAVVPARVIHDRSHSYSGAHQRALDLYGPPSILIDPAFQIVHLSHAAGRFLRQAGGVPSYNVLALVHSRLRADLRMAVLEALKTREPTHTRTLQIRQDEKNVNIRIVVQPFKDAEWNKQLVLLIFDENEVSATGVAVESPNELHNKALQALEQEVQVLAEQLQQTVESSETSTEELKASNEELQAMNEELRSATEELETSKEELQSMNEELTTVNDELKSKVIETVKINDDLQNLISSSDIVTIFVDRNMRIKWFTPKATTLFNLIQADIGRSLMDITHRLEYPRLMADAAHAFDTLRLVEREVHSVDGRSYLARILPYRTAEDRIDGAVVNFVDITELRRAQARLRDSKERIRLLVDSTTEFAFITMDTAGRITDWNHAAELMFGYEASQALGQPSEIIFTPEDRASGVPQEELRKAREEGRAADERWHIRKDGSRFYCSGVVHPLLDGKLIGYAKIARDLTNERLQRDEQQTHLQQTQASNMLKDEFIAVMSHELRHPLNLIQLNADLLSRSPGVLATKNAVKAVDSIRRSVSSQAQIIADLLDLSRVKTGKLTLNRSLISLADIVTSAVEAMQPQARDSQITLVIEGVDQDAIFNIEGDVTRIEQIVWNLLNNALKFTPSGGTVTVTLSHEDGCWVRLDVHDTGIGIAKEFLDSIFDMFKQVNRQHNETRARSGLGIGLALVDQLANAHGGRVAAASEGEGRGSTFSLWLPLRRQEARSAAVGGAPQKHSLQGMRILLADDSEEILDVLSALCEMRGAIVTTASDGSKALALLHSGDFDVLVSDLGMPNMDGYTLLASLRRSARNADVPAIALTGYGQSEKARAVGFTDQLCKPVPMDELISKLGAIHKRRS
ncbi:chemotaxis protein [Pollutimonas nitritireducens]|uniref:histidine kinase n=2 Tax=Pollutimonas nitritireducens TaxID=2045209 RepID=A0A2N4UI71_9BURK|nr:chemotaxis protein [Pollutimonas nitritireducens]